MKSYLRGQLARWIKHRQGADCLPLTLAGRRLYILPTRAGLGFALLLLLMLVAGLNYANSSALFLTFLLSGFMLVTMQQCHRNLLRIQLLSADAQATFARGTGSLNLTFANSEAMARYRIAARVQDELSFTTDVPGFDRATLELPVAAPRRGIVHIDRLLLITRHPFGLFRAWTWVHAPIEMLVYPPPLGSLPMPADTGTRTGSRAVSSSGADEWLGLRPFRDGDSPRQVDWKAYAREAPLLVKEYSAAGSELRWFDFGTLTSLQTEARLEQLSRWIVDAEAAGERYGLRLLEIHIPPDRGPSHRHRCLAALAMFGLGPPTVSAS